MWKRSGIVLEKGKAGLNAFSGADRMLLGPESFLEEFRHTGRSADRQLCCRMSLFKGPGSGPSRGDIPEPLRQGETDPAPAPPRAHCWGGPGDRVIGQLPVICSGRRGNAPWNCHCQTNLWHHNNALLWQTLLKSALNFRLVIVGGRFWSPLHSFPLSPLLLAVKHFLHGGFHWCCCWRKSFIYSRMY